MRKRHSKKPKIDENDPFINQGGCDDRDEPDEDSDKDLSFLLVWEAETPCDEHDGPSNNTFGIPHMANCSRTPQNKQVKQRKQVKQNSSLPYPSTPSALTTCLNASINCAVVPSSNAAASNTLAPSSTIAMLSLHPGPINRSAPNPREFWQATPPNCKCLCQKVAYTIFHGHKQGVMSYFDVRNKSFPGARWKGYHSMEDAHQAYAAALAAELVGPVPPHWENHHYVNPPLTPCKVIRARKAEEEAKAREADAKAEANVEDSTAMRNDSSATPRAPVFTAPPGSSPSPAIKIEELPTPSLFTPITKGKERAHQVTRLAASPAASSSLASHVVRPRLGSPLAPFHLTGCFGSQFESDNKWFVVSVGNNPGVYQGYLTASQCTGFSDEVETSEHESLRHANAHFVDLSMSGHCIRRLHTINVPRTSRLQVQHTNKDAWYVVPSRCRPGVYHGLTTARHIAGAEAGSMIICEDVDEANHKFVELYMAHEVSED